MAESWRISCENAYELMVAVVNEMVDVLVHRKKVVVVVMQGEEEHNTGDILYIFLSPL